MPKILDYNTLTTTAGCNVLFIGDKNSSITNLKSKTSLLTIYLSERHFTHSTQTALRFTMMAVMCLYLSKMVETLVLVAQQQIMRCK